MSLESKQVQFLQTTPHELATLINEKVNQSIELLKKELKEDKHKNELLTQKEAAEFLKVDASTIYHWVKRKSIKSYGIGGRRYFKRSELIESLILLNK